jgi:hypothetical protein
MVPMPKDGPILIFTPGEREIQLATADVELEFQILFTEAFTLRRAGLQSQAAIFIVRSRDQHNPMTERFAAKISGGRHQTAQICIGSVSPRHG